MKIVILAGGVGGARMARGFDAIDRVDATIVVNVGDDDLIYGVDLSPDIDTVVYMLAGVEGPLGWGRNDDTWMVMDELERFELDTSFRLGDRDLALNLFRTHMLASGVPLSSVTAAQARAFELTSTVLPATDDRVRTRVRTAEDGEWLDFQTYFVRRGHSNRVSELAYDGAAEALPAPGVLEAIGSADAVVLAPSNPFLSVLPILAIPGIREAISPKPVLAVSPFIGGETVKGPAADIMRALGHEPTPAGLAEVYDGLIDHLAVAEVDHDSIEGIEMHPTDIMIGSVDASTRLAQEMMEWLS